MARATLRSYKPEFREEAVKTVLAQGLSLEEASQRLPIPKGTLANWAVAAKRSMSVSETAEPSFNNRNRLVGTV